MKPVDRVKCFYCGKEERRLGKGKTGRMTYGVCDWCMKRASVQKELFDGEKEEVEPTGESANVPKGRKVATA